MIGLVLGGYLQCECHDSGGRDRWSRMAVRRVGRGGCGAVPRLFYPTRCLEAVRPWATWVTIVINTSRRTAVGLAATASRAAVLLLQMRVSLAAGLWFGRQGPWSGPAGLAFDNGRRMHFLLNRGVSNQVYCNQSLLAGAWTSRRSLGDHVDPFGRHSVASIVIARAEAPGVSSRFKADGLNAGSIRI